MVINVGRTTLAGQMEKKTYRDSETYEPGTELQVQFQQYPGPNGLMAQRPDFLRCTVEVLGDNPFDEQDEKGWHPIASGEDGPELDTEFWIETFRLPRRMGNPMIGGNVRAIISRPNGYFEDADYRVRVGPVPTKSGTRPSKT